MKKHFLVILIFLMLLACMTGCGKEAAKPTVAPSESVTETPQSKPTDSAIAVTNTPVPTATNTPAQTVTSTPVPTATSTPVPTATSTPVPTATSTPVPTATSTPVPTATNTPVPTATNTPVPTATNTPVPTATNTPVPTATNTPVPTATNTPSPTEYPKVDLGYHFATMMNTCDYYYQNGYVYEVFPTAEKVEITQDFDWEHFEEKITGWYKVRYKVLDKVTASNSEISQGELLDCYLLQEEETGMICYIDVPSGSGRFGSAETDYLYLILLTKKEYDNLKSKGLIRMDVDESKLDTVGGTKYFTYRPASDTSDFVHSSYYNPDKYRFEP